MPCGAPHEIDGEAEKSSERADVAPREIGKKSRGNGVQAEDVEGKRRLVVERAQERELEARPMNQRAARWRQRRATKLSPGIARLDCLRLVRGIESGELANDVGDRAIGLRFDPVRGGVSQTVRATHGPPELEQISMRRRRASGLAIDHEHIERAEVHGSLLSTRRHVSGSAGVRSNHDVTCRAWPSASISQPALVSASAWPRFLRAAWPSLSASKL